MTLSKDNDLSLNDMLLGLFPGQVYCKDKNGYYLYCNQIFADSIGLSDHNDIVGKNDYDFLSTSLADHVWQNDLKIIKSSIPLVAKEGNYLSIKTPLLHKDNKIFGLLNISIDIKDVKLQLEKT
jgi:PAS domain-containing protein